MSEQPTPMPNQEPTPALKPSPAPDRTPSRMLRGGARAATGVVIIGAAVAVALLLGSQAIAVPNISRGVPAITVDTSQNAQRQLVCSGSFGELGSDPKQPTAAIPSGDTQLFVAGTVSDSTDLERETSGGTDPRVAIGTTSEPLAFAEMQQVSTATLRGLSASICAEPSHEQWLVGGATSLGVSTTLILGNPFEVPATVNIGVYLQSGALDAAQATGVLVPAGSQRIVSINGYAPGEDAIVLRVDSTGAAVTANLGVSQTVDIRPYAVDTVSRQLEPRTQLVVPGVTNVVEQNQSGANESSADDFPVVVRLLAPGETGGVATVRGLSADGSSTKLGEVELEAGKVSELSVKKWSSTIQTVVIDSEVPVVGGVLGSADAAPNHDYAWFAPAPEIPAETDTAVAVVSGGELVLANSGETAAIVTVTEQGATASSTVNVPAGASVKLASKARLVLSSSAPIYAGVRVVNGASIAGYPVLAPPEQAVTLTVYPR